MSLDLFAPPGALPPGALPAAMNLAAATARPQIPRGPAVPVAQVILVEFEVRGLGT